MGQLHFGFKKKHWLVKTIFDRTGKNFPETEEILNFFVTKNSDLFF